MSMFDDEFDAPPPSGPAQPAAGYRPMGSGDDWRNNNNAGAGGAGGVPVVSAAPSRPPPNMNEWAAPGSNVPVVSASPSGPPPAPAQPQQQQYASQEEADIAEAIRRSQLADGGANEPPMPNAYGGGGGGGGSSSGGGGGAAGFGSGSGRSSGGGLRSGMPQWVDDEAVSHCFTCNREFDFFNRKHHCRYCGQIFCGDCSPDKKLLPVEFGMNEPQRVCNPCRAELDPMQPQLKAQLANSLKENELAPGEYTGELRRYMNAPVKWDLGAEVRKSAYTLKNQITPNLWAQHASMNESVFGETNSPELNFKREVFRNAAGLAIITTCTAGFIGSVRVGSGLVIRRIGAGWSAPCAVGTAGGGVGLVAGAEVTDNIIVLNSQDAVNTFITNGNIAIGGEASASVGPWGRTIKGDLRASLAAMAPTVSYSHSRGIYGGISLEGSYLGVRDAVNRNFYGEGVTSEQILMGDVEAPPAAQPLYDALKELYDSFEIHDFNDTAPPGAGAGVGASDAYAQYQTHDIPGGAAPSSRASAPPPRNDFTGDGFGGGGEFDAPPPGGSSSYTAGAGGDPFVTRGGDTGNGEVVI